MSDSQKLYDDQLVQLISLIHELEERIVNYKHRQPKNLEDVGFLSFLIHKIARMIEFFN